MASPAATTANYLYKVGDFCYFEVSSSGPYQIRRIDELTKSPSGQVDVRTTAFFRKRDLPERIQEKVAKFEKDHKDVPDIHMEVDEDDMENTNLTAKGDEETIKEDDLREFLLSQREIYLTRMVETLPASLIRGKCVVYLLADFESRDVYLKDEDVYFYTHTWDSNSKTLSREKGGDIRVGSGFQAEVPSAPAVKSDSQDAEMTNGAEEESVVMWLPGKMTDLDVDNFLMVFRSVGTFGRALDWNSTAKQPSLHLTAASASRDITIATAMDVIHKNNYSLTACLKELVGDGPLICRDQMELWTAYEAGLFEEALEKYGKDFEEIKTDLLPWKTMSQIIEYYYMWKTSDRFVQNKRVKAVEAESRLKQVIIQPYAQDDRLPTNEVDGPGPNKCCESCQTTEAPKWFSWAALSPNRAQEGFRLCQKCWEYWKRCGDLKRPLTGEKKLMLQQGPGIPLAAQQKNSMDMNMPNQMDKRMQNYLLPPSQRAATQMKNMFAGQMNPSRTYFRTRPAIYFIATPLMKQVRRVGERIFKPKRAARQPFQWINSAPVKEYYQHADQNQMWRSKQSRGRKPTPIGPLSLKLLKRSMGESFPENFPAHSTGRSQPGEGGRSAGSSPPMKKPRMEHTNGAAMDPTGIRLKPRMGQMIGGRMVWPDTPEDFYFHPSPEVRKERKRHISTQETRKVGRRQTDVFALVENPSRLSHFMAEMLAGSALVAGNTLTV